MVAFRDGAQPRGAESLAEVMQRLHLAQLDPQGLLLGHASVSVY